MNKEGRMLNGNLWKNILLFSVPLMLSNVLQVLFNITDIAVVGKFSSDIALGAVGSTTMLVSLYTGLLLGLGNGVNVFVARFLGAKENDKVKSLVHTGFWVSFYFGLIIMAMSLGLSYPILKLIKTKEELIDGAFLYLAIYSLGFPAMSFYNYGNGVYSANGNTRRPLIFLTISGVINLGLNLLFIICFNMGVEGVAISSVIAQYISAILIFISLKRENSEIKLIFKGIKSDKESVKNIISVGLPSGIQYAIFAIANMFIQSGINYFDHVTVEGISASTNIDSFVYEPIYAFYTAAASFISKNYGAGNKDRILKSYFISFTYAFTFALILGVTLFFYGRIFLGLFSNSSDVIDAGMQRFKVMGLVYCISAFMDTSTAACRGLGKTLVPTIMVITGTCIFRIIWIYTVFAYYHTIESLFIVYVITWVITSIPEIIYFILTYKRTTRNLISINNIKTN